MHYEFPTFTGVQCHMMPIIQGDPQSLPPEFGGYADFVSEHYLERGEIGLLTIDESHVSAGSSQRGYGNGRRKIHTEACVRDDAISWGTPPSWGGSPRVTLDPETKILIANSMTDTCMVWEADEAEPTADGDLGHKFELYSRETGVMLKAGQIAKIGIFTPHECVPQLTPGPRQFIRLVGRGVSGREEYFTENPLIYTREADQK